MQLNSMFITNILDVYGEAGNLWLKNLNQQIKFLGNLWNFNFLQSFPNLTYNFVGLVALNNNAQTAVLKMAPEGGNIINEVRWFKCFDQGVPKIFHHSEEHNAFLMEHLEPGQTLKNLSAENDDDATRIICEIIRELQSTHHADQRFQPLSKLSTVLSLLKNNFDPKLLAKAEFLFHELTTDCTGDIVLHGDLHHDNIISSGSTWKTIDPHGYLGDPVAEVGAMIRNPFDCFPVHMSLEKIIRRRLQILSDELSFDIQKIKNWAFCMTVISAAGSFEDHAKITDLEINIIKAIDQIKVK